MIISQISYFWKKLLDKIKSWMNANLFWKNPKFLAKGRLSLPNARKTTLQVGHV